MTLLTGFGYFQMALFIAIAVAGVVGAAFATTTREDAFQAGDRQSKWIWVAILVGSSFAVFTFMPFLSWVGMVAIGVWWFDVRPHLKSIVDGSAW